MGNFSVEPLHDRVVVKRQDEEETTAGGIVLAGNSKEKPVQGEVMATGTGIYLNSGDLIPMSVKVGDKVMFDKYAGIEIKVELEDYLVMREADIIGICK